MSKINVKDCVNPTTTLQIIHMRRYGMTPVFVLDGQTPDAKQATLKMRSVTYS